MTPAELATNVRVFINLCTARVGPDSIGAKQYHVDGQPQKFETMPLDDLFEYIEEEIRDLANYATMLHIRIDRLRTELNRRGLLDD
jgi:hypothetical protein